MNALNGIQTNDPKAQAATVTMSLSGHLVTNLPTLLSFDLSIHTFCNTNRTIIKTGVSAVRLAI
jgi:hypothetical protein